AAAGILGLALLLAGLVAGLPLLQPSSSSSSSSHQTPGAAHGPLTTPTATATATVTPTPTPPPNWLSVSPANMQLRCTKRTQSATRVLQNNGPESLPWRASVPFLGGVSVSPTSGTLRKGSSVTITISNTSNFISHQDAITFAPGKERAGDPVSL